MGVDDLEQVTLLGELRGSPAWHRDQAKEEAPGVRLRFVVGVAVSIGAAGVLLGTGSTAVAQDVADAPAVTVEGAADGGLTLAGRGPQLEATVTLVAEKAVKGLSVAASALRAADGTTYPVDVTAPPAELAARQTADLTITSDRRWGPGTRPPSGSPTTA